jgi:hypothetical protein
VPKAASINRVIVEFSVLSERRIASILLITGFSYSNPLPKSLPNFAPNQPESCRIAPNSTGVGD